jgi:hypothetical protein
MAHAIDVSDVSANVPEKDTEMKTIKTLQHISKVKKKKLDEYSTPLK